MNTSIRVNGTKYKIITGKANDEYVGICNALKHTIKVATTLDGKMLSNVTKKEIFTHELVHAMLDECNTELSCDENFVDAFSKVLLKTLEDRNIYDLYKKLEKEYNWKETI